MMNIVIYERVQKQTKTCMIPKTFQRKNSNCFQQMVLNKLYSLFKKKPKPLIDTIQKITHKDPLLSKDFMRNTKHTNYKTLNYKTSS